MIYIAEGVGAGGEGSGTLGVGVTSQQQFEPIANFELTTNSLFLYKYSGLTTDYP